MKEYDRNNKTVGDKWTESSEQNLLKPGKDDGNKPSREISYVMDDIGCGEEAGYRSNQWKVGALPAGGPPRYAPKGDSGMKPVKAASPSGMYAKKGGRGQRSGA